MIKKITVAKSGLKLSQLSLGFWRLKQWNLSKPEMKNLIYKTIELGITTFDHADIYGSFTCEEVFGEVLKEEPALRNQIELVTKCDIVFPSPQRPQYKFHFYDTSKQHIIESVEQSLRNFGTDYIDLLLIHRPDPFMNADDTAEGLNTVVSEGKVRFVGVSNFLPHQFDLLQSRLGFKLVTNQIEFSVMNVDPLFDGTLSQCQKLRISPMIWSPLAGGRIFTDNSEQAQRIRNELNRLSEIYNSSIENLALAWIFAHPSNPVVVVGSGKTERIARYSESVNIKLSREDWFRILAASQGNEVP
jgi:predicted oxidoreductase